MKYLIGLSNFGKASRGKYFFVDHSLILKGIIRNPNKVMLFTRPKNSSKSFTMSILNSFFNVAEKHRNEGSIKSTKIWKTEDYAVLHHFGARPVIQFSFSSILSLFDRSADPVADMIDNAKRMIEGLYREYEPMLEEILCDCEEDQKFFNKIINLRDEDNLSNEDILNAIPFLMRLLTDYYGEKCIILVDEYDMIIQANRFNSQQREKVINFFYKQLLNRIFTNDDFFEKAVLIGTAPNAELKDLPEFTNVLTNSRFDAEFSNYFGITDSEIDNILSQLEHETSITKEDLYNWYGYESYGNKVYNPFCVMKCLAKNELKSYWINTGSDKEWIIRLFINNQLEIKQIFIDLLEGKPIQMTVPIHVDFRKFDTHAGNTEFTSEEFFSFLFNAGYLAARSINKISDQAATAEFHIPNYELFKFFRECFYYAINSDEQTNPLPKSFIEKHIAISAEEAADLSLSLATVNQDRESSRSLAM